MGTATTEAAQDDPIQHSEAKVTEPTMTHHTSHTADHPYTAAHQFTTLRTAVDHIHVHPIDHQNMPHTKEEHAVQGHTLIRKPENYIQKGIGRSR